MKIPSHSILMTVPFPPEGSSCHTQKKTFFKIHPRLDFGWYKALRHIHVFCFVHVCYFVDKENQRNNQRFEGKRVMDARRSQEGPREERNNRINQEGGPRNFADDERRGGRGGRGGRGMGGRGRGDGAPRGGGRDFGGSGRGGRREFERKSGDSRT